MTSFAADKPQITIMKIFKLSLFAFLACMVISCSTDPNLTEDQNTMTVAANLADADLIGTWTGIDVSYSGSITISTGGITTVQNIQGANFNGDYTVTFSEDPNTVTREGIYSIEEENTDSSGNVSTRVIDNLNLINSSTNWTLVDNELTMDSSGKITTATILENTSDSLILRVDQNTNSTINGVSETLTKSSVFTFIR